MQNPFRFGSVVSGEDFADRRDGAGGVGPGTPRRPAPVPAVAAPVRQDLADPDAARPVAPSGLLVAYVDVFRTTTPAQLLELMAQTILRAAESRPERLLRLATELLGRLRPQVGADSRGKPTLSLDIGTSPRTALALQEEVLRCRSGSP